MDLKGEIFTHQVKGWVGSGRALSQLLTIISIQLVVKSRGASTMTSCSISWLLMEALMTGFEEEESLVVEMSICILMQVRSSSSPLLSSSATATCAIFLVFAIKSSLLFF